jgi:hypothetical protein
MKKKSESEEKTEPVEKFSADELKSDTLFPYKQHKLGLDKFNSMVQNKPVYDTPKLFVATLKKVMEDETVQPPQKDPLKIVEAMDHLNLIQPQAFADKKQLTADQRRARDIVGQKFHSYLQLLRCTAPIQIPVRVFCHMACQRGCPSDFDGYNDRAFRESNMLELEAKLEGRHSESWNNLQNASMHLMIRLTDEELKLKIAPQMEAQSWAELNPKQIGRLFQTWLAELDNEDLETKTELKEFLIPTAGQHRCAAIPRFVTMQKEVKDWQGVLGSHITANIWLRMEKNVSNYISGVSIFTLNNVS